MTGLKDAQTEDNKILDINSLMTAFEDYVDKAIAGDIGVPITYYLKPITASQLAQMWVAKYFPGKYLTAAGDDTAPEETEVSQPRAARARTPKRPTPKDKAA